MLPWRGPTLLQILSKSKSNTKSIKSNAKIQILPEIQQPHPEIKRPHPQIKQPQLQIQQSNPQILWIYKSCNHCHGLIAIVRIV